MNQKNIIAVLGVVVIVIGITVYFATINKVDQPVASDSKVVQQPVTTPVTQQTVTSSQNNGTSILNTYQNQKYGFSLSYPENYKINETNYEQEPQPGGTIHVVQFGDESIANFETDFDKGILVYVVKIEDGMANSVDSLAAPSGMDPTSKEDTIIDGQKARIYNNGEVYAVAKNGYEYLMILGSGATQSTKANLAIIASSFKFAE